MGIFNNHWRRRAERAEAALADLKGMCDMLEKMQNERNVLISITRDGRVNRWRFLRNGVLVDVETLGSWDDDVEAWKKALLEPLT